MKAEKWNTGWKFWEEKDAFALVWSVPESARAVALPHDAMHLRAPSPDSPNGPDTGYLDGGNYIYVKQFHAPGEWRGQTVSLKFEGVYMNALVYLNGQLVGKRPYGYSQFYVPLNDYLNYGGENELRVLVKNSNMPNSRWYSGSGITRDVSLLTGGPVTLEPDGLFVSTRSLEDGYAVLEVGAELRNRDRLPWDARLEGRIINPEGKEAARFAIPVFLRAGAEERLTQTVTVDSPALWCAEAPALYRCEARLTAGAVELDRDAVSFGVRTLHLDARRGLRVNGKSVKLRGACIHHDNGPLGAITAPDAELRRVRILKEAGFNAIRMAHNPASIPLLDACDKLGMYVMDESFDVWTRPKKDLDYSLFSDKWWREDVTAMVRKDRPHPCVVLYSLGNEIPEVGMPQGSALGREMARLVRELDAERFTMVSINGVFAAGDQVDRIMADVMSNAAPGAEEGGNVNDFMTAMDAHMDEIVRHPIVSDRIERAGAGMDAVGYNYMTARYEPDAEQYPHRVVVGSETYPPEIARNWALVEKLPGVIGDFTWTGWDYIGETGIGIPGYRPGEGGFGAALPCRLAYCGDIDITGFRRPASYFREIVFGLRQDPYITVQDPAHYGEPVIKTSWVISDSCASWSWPGFEGKPAVVEVYSPGTEVELLLDGESLGKKPCGPGHNFTACFELPYQPGTLTAVARDGEAELGRTELATAGAAVRLEAVPEPGGEELVYVDLTLRDENGLAAGVGDVELRVSVSGPGELAGLGSGSPRPAHSFAGDVARTFRGRALAILRRTGDGEIALRAETDTGLRADLTLG